MFTSMRGLVPKSLLDQSKPTNNMLAIVSMILGSAFFVLNDMTVKLVSEHVPTGQIITIRGMFAIALLLVLVGASGAWRSYRTMTQKPNLLRAFMEGISTFFFLTALFNMPLGDITAILQAVPLVVTAGAAIVLREQVGWRRWGAILVGFLGVLLIVRPGMEGFSIYSIFGLCAVLTSSVRDLSARRLSADIPTMLVSLTTLFAVLLLGIGLSIGEAWVPLSGSDYLTLCVAAALLICAHQAITLATRFGDISVVSPFRYTSVVIAIALGFVVWGDVPDLLMMVGVIVVIATGIYSIYRERIRAGL